MALETIAIFAGIVLFIAVIPGPNALLILYTSITLGEKNAFANVLGVAVGFIIHSLISAAGLSIIMSQSAFAFEILKWLGTVYLVFLGITNLRIGLTHRQVAFPIQYLPKKHYLDSFLKGMLTNLLNPKIVLFYLSIFPQFVSAQDVVFDSLVLGATQALIVTAWFSLVIMAAHKLKSFFSNPSTKRWLNLISGTVFISFGIKLAYYRP